MEVILQCGPNDKIIKNLGQVLYELPLINSYVLKIADEDLEKLNQLEQITYFQSTKIAAQMETERRLLDAESAYSEGLTGKGISIAFLDTGVSPVADFTIPKNRISAFIDIINNNKRPYDDNGHGTHVCGIATGNGYNSGGRYMGIAPESNVISIKVLDKDGVGNSIRVLAGLQWIIDNHEEYNIRIVNLSVGASNSNTDDPLVKGVEALWDSGIIVVAAAGNNGPTSGTITSPGISKKIITVGAADDNEQVEIWGNSLVNFSGRGPTADCIIKPDVLAPGANIISCLGNNNKYERIVSKNYHRLSGTSMATPMVSGALALLLQKYPKIAPNSVKYLIKISSSSLGFPGNQQGWGLLNIKKLIGGVSDRNSKQFT